jgi:Tfp pilus assembly protein PilE
MNHKNGLTLVALLIILIISGVAAIQALATATAMG